MVNITTFLIIILLLLFIFIISFFVYKYFNNDIISLKTIENFDTQNTINSILLYWQNLGIFDSTLLNQNDKIDNTQIISLLTSKATVDSQQLSFTIEEFSSISSTILNTINYNSWVPIDISGNTYIFRPLPESIRMFNLINSNNSLINDSDGLINNIIVYTNTELNALKARSDSGNWNSEYTETPLSESLNTYLQNISTTPPPTTPTPVTTTSTPVTTTSTPVTTTSTPTTSTPTTSTPVTTTSTPTTSTPVTTTSTSVTTTPVPVTTTPVSVTTTPTVVTTTPVPVTTTPVPVTTTFDPFASIQDDEDNDGGGIF